MAQMAEHPGIRLRREALPRFGGSLPALAGRLDVSVGVASELLDGRVTIGPALAARIATVLGGERTDWYLPLDEGVELRG
ncbi:MAG: hypothetical protein GC150_03460 [Rhizobiales bacterium]|nr:hypothetical protein [Hyphomicrobiales bacterium]